MPDTAEARAREIVAQWLDHGADMLSSGPHERPVITEGLVTLIASAITASAEAMRERAAKVAENDFTICYPDDGSQASWTVWRPMIASAIRALPLSSDAAAISAPPSDVIGEHIVRAAIQWQGGVWSVPRPGRHGDVFSTMGKLNQQFTTQGFLTSTGRFVNRFEAYDIARNVGQIIRKTGPSDELFSEDLW